MGDFFDKLRTATLPENGSDFSFSEAVGLIPEYREDPAAALAEGRRFIADVFLNDPRITIDSSVMNALKSFADKGRLDAKWVARIDLANRLRQSIHADRRLSCREEGSLRQETLSAGLLQPDDVEDLLKGERGLARVFDAGVDLEKCTRTPNPLKGVDLEWEEEPAEPETPVAHGPYFSLTLASDITQDPGAIDGADEQVLLPLSHPLALQSLFFSLYSGANAVVDHWIPQSRREKSVFWRLGSVGAKGAPILFGSYWNHELAGHIRGNFNSHDEDFFKRGNIPSSGIIDDIAGINANAAFAQRLVLMPYEGVVTDLARVVHTLDLPFYMSVQEPWIRYVMDDDEGGDVGAYLAFREERGGGDESVPLALLGGWQILGTIPPAVRVVDYIRTGQEPEDPTRPGSWTVSTTGYLSPTGPLFGLKGYFFRRRRGPFPSAITGEAWYSRVRQGHESYPFGFRGELVRGRLPVKIGHLGLAVSVDGLFSANLVDDWGNKEDNKKWREVVGGGGLGLHLQGARGEFFVSTRYKSEGFLPDELYESGMRLFFGVTTSLDSF